MTKKFCVLLLAVLGIVFTGCANMQLAKDGETAYEIVKPDRPTAVDDYAMKELYNFFKQKTGAALAVAEHDKMSPDRKHIFVGVSEPALKILGKSPLDGLKEQEYVVRSEGTDIFLYGKGIHGNLYAVLDFMENSLGRRWYSNLDKPVFSIQKDLEIKSFDRKCGFDFEYRTPIYESEWDYQNKMNMGFSEQNARYKEMEKKDFFPAGVVSYKFVPAFVHNTFSYIPPNPESDRYKFPFVTNKNYFQSNPEYFSFTNGKRVPDRQLCYSNPGLRAELTKNFMEHARQIGGKDLEMVLGQEDNSGVFCECPECKKLEKAYGNPGGCFYDYLLELCTVMKEKYPDVKILFGAYRLEQTQKPPVLPEGKKFPDNLSVFFANVLDNTDLDWNSPENNPTYRDLLSWKKVVPDVRTWYYPNPYTTGSFMPLGNTARLVNDLRMMKKAGCRGVFYEFTTESVWTHDNFTELQKYLIYKLSQNADSDVGSLTREFTDYQYGPAASLVCKYMDELEDARKTAKQHIPLTVTVVDFDKEFAYLTNERIYRWQGYFDSMEKDTASEQRCLANVKRLRRCLDLATLGKWNSLAKEYPDYFKDYLVYKNRVSMLRKGNATSYIEDCETMIKTGGIQKPLPPQFDGIEKSSIRRLTPINSANNTILPRTVLDPDAAFGYAATVELPDMPFNFGFFTQDTKTHGPRPKLEAADIKPGVYQLYKLGEIKVTPDCIIWFSSKSWMTNLQLGGRLYEPGENNIWDAWVSLKFDGPAYGGKAKEDFVVCDQIILVKK